MTTTRSALRMAKPPSKKSGKGSKAARKSQESNATSKPGSGGESPDAKADSGPVVREGADPKAALSMSEAAARVGVAARTLQRRAGEGRLPVVVEQRGQRSIWRVLPADLAAAFPERAGQILAELEPQPPSPAPSQSPAGGAARVEPIEAAERSSNAPPNPSAKSVPSEPSATPSAKQAEQANSDRPSGQTQAGPTESQLGEGPQWISELASARERLQVDLDQHKEVRHGLERELAVSQTRLESARAQVVRLESQVQGLQQSHRSEISSQDERHHQAILAMREALEVAREELSAAKAMPLSIEAPDTEELQRKSRRQIAGAVAAVAFGLGGPLLWAAMELDTVRASQKELQTERDGLVTQTQRDQGELTARRAELDQLRDDLTRESELKDQHLSDLAVTREQAAQLGEQLASAQDVGELLASERDAAEESARQAELERVQAQAEAAAKAERVADLEGDLNQLGDRLISSEERRGDLELQVQVESERAELRSAEIERLMGELEAWRAEREELIEQLTTLRSQLAAESAKDDPESATPGSSEQPVPGSPGGADGVPVSAVEDSANGANEPEAAEDQEASSASATGPFIWRRVGGYWWPLPDLTV